LGLKLCLSKPLVWWWHPLITYSTKFLAQCEQEQHLTHCAHCCAQQRPGREHQLTRDLPSCHWRCATQQFGLQLGREVSSWQSAALQAAQKCTQCNLFSCALSLLTTGNLLLIRTQIQLQPDQKPGARPSTHLEASRAQVHAVPIASVLKTDAIAQCRP
jgi:hypothetical protein